MFNHQLRAIGLLIVAALLLGACAPATGTPPAANATQSPAGTPLAAATPAPLAVSPTAPPAPAFSFKSKDPATLTYLQFPGDPATLDPALDYETTGGEVIQNT